MTTQEQKTEFERNLDRLELTQLHRGFNYAVADLEKILKEALNAATTPEECALIIKVQAEMYAMERVRFPDPEQKN